MGKKTKGKTKRQMWLRKQLGEVDSDVSSATDGHQPEGTPSYSQGDGTFDVSTPDGPARDDGSGEASEPVTARRIEQFVISY